MASAVKALSEHFQLQADLDARVIILSLFAEISGEPGADVQVMFEKSFTCND